MIITLTSCTNNNNNNKRMNELIFKPKIIAAFKEVLHHIFDTMPILCFSFT